MLLIITLSPFLIYLRTLYHLWIKILASHFSFENLGCKPRQTKDQKLSSCLSFFLNFLLSFVGSTHGGWQGAQPVTGCLSPPCWPEVSFGECIQVSFQWPYQQDIQVHAWLLIECRVQTQLRCGPSQEGTAFVLSEHNVQSQGNNTNDVLCYSASMEPLPGLPVIFVPARAEELKLQFSATMLSC